jgi:glycosyltransferase involved in cell wall biosynthesis
VDPRHGTRLLVLIVAYNAQSIIEKVLGRIPKSIFECDYEILIIDDRSSDRTFEIATGYMCENAQLNLRVLTNPESRGYGGNQKIGYHYAIRRNFEVVVLLHADGAYAPESMGELIRPIIAGEADAVLGTRMLRPWEALRVGMPFYKWLGNRVLTGLQNRLLGTKLSEFHCGYRAYAVRALRSVPFQLNSDDYHFDTEIVIQLITAGCRVVETPVPVYYGREIRRAKGLVYAWRVLRTTLEARLQRMQIYYRRQYDVLGPTVKYPVKLGYRSSHTMAIDEVKANSRVLDIGCGEGFVGKELEKKGCCVQGMDEALFEGQCLLERFEKVDLHTQSVPLPPDVFDYILLLDILEHLDSRRQYELLDDLRARSVRKKPTVIITMPNVAFFLTRLQLLLGQFNYGKRGILDLTHRRLHTFQALRRMLEESGYCVGRMEGIPAPYPAALGMTFTAKMLLAINSALIALMPKLMSYQIFVTAVPRPTVDELLDAAEESSREH